MTTAEPKRNAFQNAVYNFFAVVGVTPPAPGQEWFYLGVVLAVSGLIALGCYLAVRLLMSQMLG
jgi:hypothetical protein